MSEQPIKEEVTQRTELQSEVAALERLEAASLFAHRLPPHPTPGAAADSVHQVLHQGIMLHSQLIDQLHGILAEEEDGTEECTEMLQSLRALLAEMRKTLQFFPDRVNFERDYRIFRQQSGGAAAEPSTTASSFPLLAVIGTHRIDVYRLYFEVWEYIGERGRDPRAPLSYEDEATLRATYIDLLYPFECYNRQRFDGDRNTDST